MAKQKTVPKNAKDLAMAIISAMDTEFHDGTDRVIAIVGAAYLDDCLETLLRAALREDGAVENLVGQRGVCGANGARARLAYCLGLIRQDQYEDLKTVAAIRNKFAHDYQLRTFDAPEIKAECARLTHPEAFVDLARKTIKGGEAEHAVRYARDLVSSPRGQYEETVRGLLVSLVQRVNFVRRVDEREWFSEQPA